MNAFALLYQALDQSTATHAREKALQHYFSHVDSAEASWAVYILSGSKINTARNRIASTAQLRLWLSELTQLPSWMVDDCHRHVGDLAETLALLLEAQRDLSRAALPTTPGNPAWKLPDNHSTLREWIEDFLLPLVHEEEIHRKQAIQAAWLQLDAWPRFVFNKLLTGSLRIGVSKRMLQASLAPLAGVKTADMAHRLIGDWTPTPQAYERLMSPDANAQSLNKPYPFYLASPLQDTLASLGQEDDWLAEWKWDGIRVQLVRREGQPPYLWSRGEERLDGRFPELELQALQLPCGLVLDGELLAWDEMHNSPLPFISLQKRIQKRQPSASLQKKIPVRIVFYDLLELENLDWRARPLQERRNALQRVVNDSGSTHFQISPELHFQEWSALAEQREQAAQHHAEGLMLKLRSSPYLDGRKRGAWWKWKQEPYTIDAVLVYAQSGSGRRSTLHTDYTFAVWADDETLVPIAKAYSGLTDAELQMMDKWIRSHTVQRFGPVRSVQAIKVFEIAFEAVNRSSRHKSGVAVRFPRIVRIREDKQAKDADRLATLLALCQD